MLAAMRAQTRVQDRFLGGRPPYGYRLVDGGRRPNPVHGRWGRRVQVLAPDPVTAPWVRWMFAERARGRTVASLVRELNERGVVCPSGADPGRNAHRSGERWIVRTVAMILENPRCAGRQVWNRSSTTGHGAGGRGSGALRYNPFSEWEVSERIAHEPLVDDERFVAVQGCGWPSLPRTARYGATCSLESSYAGFAVVGWKGTGSMGDRATGAGTVSPAPGAALRAYRETSMSGKITCLRRCQVRSNGRLNL